MSAANYHDTMIAAQHPKQSKRKLRLPWWTTAIPLSAASYYVFDVVHRTGNWVLVTATWAALLIVVAVLFRSALKQERQRRTSTN